MENKDFRFRLKNHKVPMNENSWQKMQMLLEADDVPEKKKKRGLFFWLLLSGMLLIASFVIGDLFLNEFSNPHTSKDLEVKIVNNENALETQSFQLDRNNEIQKSNSNGVAKSTTQNKTIIDAIEDENLMLTTTRSDELKKQQASESNNVTNQNGLDSTEIVEDLNPKDDSMRNRPQDNTSGNLLLSKPKDTSKELSDIKSTNTFLSNVNTNSEEKIRSEDKLINEGLPVGDDLTASLLTRNITEVPLAKPLPNRLSNYLYGTRELNDALSIVAPSQKRWFYYGQIGYAQFNGNPGLTFGGGVLYQLDNILHIESGLTYSYGNEGGVLDGEPRTKEREIDLALNIQMNLFSKNKSRLSFEVGYGFTKYWGQRIIRSEPITIDLRNSFGTHYQGGIAYTYKIDRDNQLSLKFGVIGYDDSITYLALKYYKRL